MQVLFGEGGSELISCSDDKTLRFWDCRTGQETHKIALPGSIGGIELSRDETTLAVAQGNKVTFFNVNKYAGQNLGDVSSGQCKCFVILLFSREKIKEVEVPCQVFSASLLKEQNIFVCGGEDLKLYKFNYETGIEIGESTELHCLFEGREYLLVIC